MTTKPITLNVKIAWWVKPAFLVIFPLRVLSLPWLGLRYLVERYGVRTRAVDGEGRSHVPLAVRCPTCGKVQECEIATEKGKL